jgi:hypothetical protein
VGELNAEALRRLRRTIATARWRSGWPDAADLLEDAATAVERIPELEERNERLEAVVLGVRPGPGAGLFVSVGDLVGAERERDRWRQRAEVLEAAAQRYIERADAWAASNALVVHPTLGVPMFRRNAELHARDAAFAELRATLADAPAEEGRDAR